MGDNKKIMLMDVVLMRLSLIFLLVMCHALAIYTGSWDRPFPLFPKILVYDWLGSSIHGFRLESMVFISGLLFGYILKIHPERLSFKSCVIKKAKRVLLPCYIFGIAYLLLFNDSYGIKLDNMSSIGGGILLILNGIGHLWFLPMIFWCFVVTYILEITHSCKVWFIPIFFLFTAYNVVGNLPLGIGRVPSFYLYFYVGYMMQRGRLVMPQIKNCWWLVLIFLITFCIRMYFKNYFAVTSMTDKIFRFGVGGLNNSVESAIGVYLLYRFANIPSIQMKIKDNAKLIKLSGYCYGVYIFQQFILKFLYYKTDFTIAINPYLVPWIALILTIALSLMLTGMCLKTRFGRFLIG